MVPETVMGVTNDEWKLLLPATVAMDPTMTTLTDSIYLCMIA